MEQDKIVVKLFEELNDFMSDRYAEYITTDELDAAWSEIALKALKQLEAEYEADLSK